jgi:thioredoxin reductase (NADPH)
MQNLVIVGTGPAGLTAAIYAARAGLKPVVYAGLQHGGQLTTTTEVENFPGFAKGIMGPELMNEMTEQATRVGAEVKYSYITKVDFSTPDFKLWSDKEEISAKAVILSTGATARTLGLANEDKLMGRGISTCATCDGFFYRNKTVAVVGGGDSAMEEALYLANLCKEVVLLHRRDVFRASEIMLARARKHEKIRFMLPYTVAETKFDETGLTSLVVENIASKEQESLVVDGLFYAIGHTPNTEIFLPYVALDEHGYIKVKNYTETKTPGVFAAGDVADPLFKQAITAAGMGCQAAIQAAKYIENLES